MAPKKAVGKKVAAAPGAQKKVAKQAATNPLFEKRSRNFGIGSDVQPKRDLSRFVKWPKYIRLQRQKAVLLQRLKVPPALNQFTKTLDKHTTSELFRLCEGYRPETKAQRKERLSNAALAQTEGRTTESKKPVVLKYGINHVTGLIEKKKAKMVIIAHDVDPVEIVVWLPALCRKMGVPYCIVKGKARLGSLIHMKTASCLAITEVKAGDQQAFSKIAEAVNNNFTEKWEEDRKHWGGGIMGNKSTARTTKLEKARARELASRL